MPHQNFWAQLPTDSKDERAEANTIEPEKRKRAGYSEQLEAVFALMDDEEREAFKASLKERMLARTSRLMDIADDGEGDTVSLESLLETRNTRR